MIVGRVGMKRGDGAAAGIDRDLIGLTKVGDALSGISVSLRSLMRLKPSPVAYPDLRIGGRRVRTNRSALEQRIGPPQQIQASLETICGLPRRETQYAMLKCAEFEFPRMLGALTPFSSMT
jgi:hypothetical protein